MLVGISIITYIVIVVIWVGQKVITLSKDKRTTHC